MDLHEEKRKDWRRLGRRGGYTLRRRWDGRHTAALLSAGNGFKEGLGARTLWDVGIVYGEDTS